MFVVKAIISEDALYEFSRTPWNSTDLVDDCKLTLSLELTQLKWARGGEYRQLYLLNIKEVAGNILM